MTPGEDPVNVKLILTLFFLAEAFCGYDVKKITL